MELKQPVNNTQYFDVLKELSNEELQTIATILQQQLNNFPPPNTTQYNLNLPKPSVINLQKAPTLPSTYTINSDFDRMKLGSERTPSFSLRSLRDDNSLSQSGRKRSRDTSEFTSSTGFASGSGSVSTSRSNNNYGNKKLKRKSSNEKKVERRRNENAKSTVSTQSTSSESVKRSKKLHPGTSRYTGVTWHIRDKGYTARLWLRKKTEYLGTFKSELQAALVVDACLLNVKPSSSKEAEYIEKRLNFRSELERDIAAEIVRNFVLSKENSGSLSPGPNAGQLSDHVDKNGFPNDIFEVLKNVKESMQNNEQLLQRNVCLAVDNYQLDSTTCTGNESGQQVIIRCNANLDIPRNITE